MRTLKLAAFCGTSALVFAFAAACTTTVTQLPFDGTDGGKTTGSNGTTPKPDGGDGGKKATTGTGICADFCAKAASENCSSQSTCEADCKKQIDTSPADCKDEAEALIKCAGTTG